jgi:hypothetical protein
MTAIQTIKDDVAKIPLWAKIVTLVVAAVGGTYVYKHHSMKKKYGIP